MVWVISGVVFVLLVGRHHYPTLPRSLQLGWWSLLCVVAVIVASDSVELALGRLTKAREWDFLTYWLDGRVAISELNVYDPAAFQRQSLPIIPSPEFVQEKLQVGMFHPPLSILLFAPFGALDYFTAYKVWTILNGVVLSGCVYLLYRLYMDVELVPGLLLTLVLVLMLSGTVKTIRYGQSNFIVLLLVLLAFRDRERPLAGAWIALGFVVKPIIAIFLAWLLVRRSMGALVVALAVMTALYSAVLILFGADVVLTYFSSPPVERIPDYLYFQRINHSALATFLRLFDVREWESSPLFFPPYIAFTLAVISATFWAVHRSEKTEWSFAATLLAGMLIYPHSLSHYTVLLLLPVLLIWARRGDAGWMSLVVALVYAMSQLTRYDGIFALHLMLWVLTVYRTGVFGRLRSPV